jgi:threonine aldolase
MNQPLPPSYLAAVAAIARQHDVPLHVDGARFFNASVALGVTPRELAASVDSVAFCLSKGLGCPIGSLVVGDRAFVDRARRARKLVGGGMRQVGVVAAAGLVALADGPDGMIDRLEEDHLNARRLAEAIAGMPGIVSPGGIAQPGEGPLDPERVRTNFILFRVERDRGEFLEALRAGNVLMVEYPHGQVRAVTHHGITGSDIEATISAVGSALESTTRRSATDAIPAGHLQGV